MQPTSENIIAQKNYLGLGKIQAFQPNFFVTDFFPFHPSGGYFLKNGGAPVYLHVPLEVRIKG